MELTPILVVGIVFSSVVTVIYLLIRKQERMAMMQYGVDLNKFYENQRNSISPIRYGILLIGLGLGFFFGNMLGDSTDYRGEAYLSMIFLFVGIALVISYIIEKKERKKRN